jgi:hypothetical protein
MEGGIREGEKPRLPLTFEHGGKDTERLHANFLTVINGINCIMQ